jgi:hypothetical protein
MRLKLKAICFGVNFQCSERTNYERFKKSKQFPGELDTGETYLFVSKTGNQLVWIFNTGKFMNGKERDITDSRRWRLSGGEWSPKMLANYASEVGIELLGIRRFEEQYNESRRRRAEG